MTADLEIIDAYNRWLSGKRITAVTGDAEYIRITVEDGANVEFRRIPGMGYLIGTSERLVLPEIGDLEPQQRRSDDLAQENELSRELNSVSGVENKGI